MTGRMIGTAKPILPAGASGVEGVLAWRLAGPGTTLRPADIAPLPDEALPLASFTRADLAGGPAIPRLTEGCGAIVHLGGTLAGQPFEAVTGPGIRGLHHASVP